MQKSNKTIIFIILVLVVVAIGLYLLGSGPRTQTTTGSIEETVGDFYEWYIDYAKTANPLVDRAYAQHEAVTQSLVDNIDAIVASFEFGGYDPMLCAQDVPEFIVIEETRIENGRGYADVSTSFVGHGFDVVLLDQEGEWKIDDVVCRIAQDM